MDEKKIEEPKKKAGKREKIKQQIVEAAKKGLATKVSALRRQLLGK